MPADQPVGLSCQKWRDAMTAAVEDGFAVQSRPRLAMTVDSIGAMVLPDRDVILVHRPTEPLTLQVYLTGPAHRTVTTKHPHWVFYDSKRKTVAFGQARVIVRHANR